MSAPRTILHKPNRSTCTRRSSSTSPFLSRVVYKLELKTVSFSRFSTNPNGETISRMSGSMPIAAAHALKSSTSTNTGDPEKSTQKSISCKGGIGASFEHKIISHSRSSEFCPYYSVAQLESSLNRLSKWLLSAFIGAILLWRHDTEALWAATGYLVNSGLSTILKKLLNQERPVSSLRSDPGMPSSHAQTIFFTIIFSVTSMFECPGVTALTITISGLTLAFGSYLSWLRVTQQLHTISQVVAGAAVGTALSIFWFWSWDAVVLQAFISHLWVRVILVFGGAGFCIGLLIHIIRVLKYQKM